MKKLLPLCLVLVLALALAVPAAASSAASLSAAGVSVQVNGENISFPNASPEVTNGRTMVPMRAVLEALGAKVDYADDTRTVTATLGDVSLTHVIDTNTIEMGSGEKLTMDTTSYVSKGSTLVPLRFFSQALGYEVYWDEGQRTAVVIDKADFISKTDKNFTILNGLQAEAAGEADEAGDTAMDMDVSGEIKLLDGTSDEALPFSAKMTALVSDKAVNISGTMDLSAIAKLAESEDDSTADGLVAALGDLTFEIIGGEALWMNIPALSSLISGVPAEGDVWLKSDDFNMSTVSAAAATSSADATIGSVLYEVVEYMDADGPVNIYQDVTQAANILTTLLGDDTFTKDGDDYSWELDETVSALLASTIGADPDSTAFSMEIKIKADGSGSFSMKCEVEDVFAMSLSGDSSDTSASVKCQLTVPEAFEMTIQSTATVKDSDKAPVTAPPAGATIIDVDELADAPETAPSSATDAPVADADELPEADAPTAAKAA